MDRLIRESRIGVFSPMRNKQLHDLVFFFNYREDSYEMPTRQEVLKLALGPIQMFEAASRLAQRRLVAVGTVTFIMTRGLHLLLLPGMETFSRF